MNVTPLPRAKCGPAKPRRYPPDVIGTPNVSYGHRLRERSNCRVTKSHDKKSGSKVEKYERPDERREHEALLKTWEFERHTNRRIRRRNVQQRVQQGLKEYEDSVNLRREKLRDIILEEEMNLTREIVEQAQRGDESRMDEMRAKTIQLEKQREQQRLAVVAAKRMQQYLARCPEIRDELTKRSSRETKLCNAIQITENLAKREAGRELDSLWHELMLKEVEQKKLRETEETKKRTLVAQETMTTLAKQVAGKLALEEDEKRVQREEREHLENLWETVRQEELRNLERERKNRETLKKDLEQQILSAKRFLVDRAREDAAIDRAMKDLADEELAKERASIKESSAALRRELVAYLDYLEDIRREEARRNLEVNAIVEQSTRDAHARRELAVRKFKEARERILQDVLRGREEQVRTKREKEKEERELRLAEKEQLEREIAIDAKLVQAEGREARRKALLYGQELKEQRQQYADAARRREVEEEERVRREKSKAEEEYQKLTQELLEASGDITPHPFKVLLKECAARYAAEKEGRCYCPPSLHPE